MNPQLQNWQNFCQHQAGNWHGFWTRYNSEREETESFQCIRSLQVKENGDKIEHQNQYKYQDGMQETKTFGPYIKPLTKALFLMQGFSWGSQEIKSETKFFFETGFRYQNRRASLGVVYNENHELEKITVISEHQEVGCRFPSPLHQHLKSVRVGRDMHEVSPQIISCLLLLPLIGIG